jgi:hypothetical protein
VKLRLAQAAIDVGNIPVSCLDLDLFIRDVTWMARAGLIPSTKANELNAMARTIQASLGCV